MIRVPQYSGKSNFKIFFREKNPWIRTLLIFNLGISFNRQYIWKLVTPMLSSAIRISNTGIIFYHKGRRTSSINFSYIAAYFWYLENDLICVIWCGLVVNVVPQTKPLDFSRLTVLTLNTFQGHSRLIRYMKLHNLSTFQGPVGTMTVRLSEECLSPTRLIWSWFCPRRYIYRGRYIYLTHTRVSEACAQTRVYVSLFNHMISS